MEGYTNILIVGGIVLAVGLLALVKFTNKTKTKNTKGQAKANTIHPTPKYSEADLSKATKQTKAAKTSFLENIDRFTPMLTSLSDGSFNASDWTETIVDINNDELTQYWIKANKSADSLCRLLASWGIKSDNCTSFRAMDIHREMYKQVDGSETELGKTYSVVRNCWIMTDSDNTNKVIVFGIVKAQ